MIKLQDDLKELNEIADSLQLSYKFRKLLACSKDTTLVVSLTTAEGSASATIALPSDLKLALDTYMHNNINRCRQRLAKLGVEE